MQSSHVSQRRDLHQGSHPAGGVMQTNEGTVTFKCEGCGVRKPEAERYRPRSAFTVCSQACLDTAAQKKAQTLHDPRSRDMLATDWRVKKSRLLSDHCVPCSPLPRHPTNPVQRTGGYL